MKQYYITPDSYKKKIELNYAMTDVATSLYLVRRQGKTLSPIKTEFQLYFSYLMRSKSSRRELYYGLVKEEMKAIR